MPTADAQVLLININGHDRVGVTHSLMEVMSSARARILDIGQALIHDNLTLGILIEFTDEMRACPLLTDLLLRAHQLGVQIRFTAISQGEYETWVASQSKRRFMITVLGPEITAVHLSAVSGIIARHGMNIDLI